MVRQQPHDCPSPVLANLNPSLTGSPKISAPPPLLRWMQQAEALRKEALVFYFAFKHPRVRWYARVVAVCTAAYLLSPIQLIPSYIPVIGFLDDLLVLFLGVKVLRKIVPRDVLAECRQHAEAVENRAKERIISASAVLVIVVIVSLWLLATVMASLLTLKYFRR
jgi:uncharacterized membrane protein YkvA (DUF1232 family)